MNCLLFSSVNHLPLRTIVQGQVERAQFDTDSMLIRKPFSCRACRFHLLTEASLQIGERITRPNNVENRKSQSLYMRYLFSFLSGYVSAK